MHLKVGIIGLGHMGSLMATNLLEKFDVTAYDVNKEALESAVKAGAKRVSSPKEVAKETNVIVMSLPNDAIVEGVVLSENGVLKGAKRGSCIIDTSTVSPETTKKLAKIAEENGVEYLDATSGSGTLQLREKKMTMYIGGKKRIFEKYKKVLEGLGGSNLTYMGPSGSGNTIKVIFNTFIGMYVCSIAEAMVFGAKAGIDPNLLIEIMSKDKDFMWRRIATPMVARKFEGPVPYFSIDLITKDLGLGIDLAKQLQTPLPMAGLTHQMFQIARAQGYGKKDFSAIILPYEGMADTRIKSTK